MSLPSLITFPQLVRRIRQEILLGQRTIDQQRALVYWKVGKYISDFILHGKNRAGYGEKLYEHLSTDLGVGAKTLERAVRFSREFSIQTPGSELKWSHYRELLAITDKNQRTTFQRRVIQKGLSKRQLIETIFKSGHIPIKFFN